jgi:uncharacterized protein with NAD-binding domain and iron-sulfur cluster
MTDAKQRIVILGGGVSALCAAFALSEIDPKGEKYDITLYQMGWRLGGKCASGRNAEFGQRIEEHGLHVWAGFYENAFTVMRAAIKALNGPPFLTIGDAFKRQNEIFYAEQVDGDWLPWPFWFQPDADPNEFPGRDNLWAPYSVLPSLSTVMLRAIAAIIFGLDYYTNHWPGDHKTEVESALALMAPERRKRFAEMFVAAQTGGKQSGHPLLSMAVHVGKDLDSPSEAVRRGAQADMIALLQGFQALVRQYRDNNGLNVGLRRLLVLVDLGVCMLLGMLKHDCMWDGIEVLDPLDFRAFLAEEDPSAADSAIITALYEYIFAYKAGSREAPLVSASTAVQGLLRLFFTYKGAFFFKAVYGMGDTICTPLYQLLKQRGVKFKFFHKVVELQPSADGSNIATVVIDRQVDLADGAQEYNPFFPVKGFQSWPSVPNWDQLRDGKKLACAGYDFENAYGPPDPPQPPVAERLPLQAGKDFDKVILGISMGALPQICAPLIAQKKAWADMVANLATVRTQALQLWMTVAREKLGGPYVAPPAVSGEQMGPIVTTFQPPFDTYSDMSQLLPAEDWKAGSAPLSVGYFCGVFADEDAPNNEKIAADNVKAGASNWMTTYLDGLWQLIGTGQNFHWDWLFSPHDLVGPARLDDQYWRCNINPSDRYVQSLPGTLQYRMEPGRSGYGNLVLAGDWTRVPEINAGCVEVAAMSGLMAASAASGVHIPIVAWDLKPSQINHANRLAALAAPKPAYINYAGWATLPAPPFFCNDTSLYSFSFAASASACQKFLDRSYNAVAGYQRFRFIGDSVMLNIVDSRKTGATTQPFLNEGTASGTDIGFWLLVGSYAQSGRLEAIGMIPAYLFVDSAWSVMAAREIWGFPKVYSVMELPDTAPSFGPFKASALSIAKFAPTAQASRLEVLKLTGSQVEAGAVEADAASTVDTFKRGVLGVDNANLTADPVTLAALAAPWPLAGPVFFIKQTRSAEDSTSASYQELLQGSLTLTNSQIPQNLFGNWTLELSDYDSYPFIHDLGLGTPTNGKLALTTHGCLFAKIDFTVDLATAMN